MTKHFYIFRHGQCPFNVSGHIQGQRFNGNLTPEGRRQAARTAEKLKDKHITLIVSSPMKRALQTAAIVAGRCHAPILVDHRFIEVNMGIVEGMHISAVEKNFAELYDRWRHDKQGNIRFMFGETKSEVRRRILQGLNYYAENTPHPNIGISSHGIAISQMLQYFNIDRCNIPNGAVLHLSYDAPSWQYQEFMQ